MNPWYIHLIFIKANLEFHLLLQQCTQVVEIKDVTSHKQKKKLKFSGPRYIHDILFTSSNAHE